MCIVAKPDGSPQFVWITESLCNIFLREMWPMPDIEFHFNTLSGTEFITVCDLQGAFW